MKHGIKLTFSEACTCFEMLFFLSDEIINNLALTTYNLTFYCFYSCIICK